MKLSLSNGIFCRKTLKENFAAVKSLGFKNIEFNMKSVEVEDDVSVYEAKRLLDDSGLTCLTLHAAIIYVKDEIELHRAIYYVKISADFAHRLGAPVMVVHSNVSKKLPVEYRNKILRTIFGELKPYAKSLGLKLALENLTYATTGFGKNSQELEQIFETIGNDEMMGVTLDFSHSTSTGNTEDILEKYHNRLYNVHMANRRHAPFLEPTPNLIAFLAQLENYGYMGPISVELSRKCSVADIAATRRVLEEILRVGAKNISYR